MANLFTDAFGPDAYVGRPGPNGFTVRTRNPLQPTTGDEGYAFGGLHQDTAWTYDNNTQTFTNPNTGAKVPIGSLGFKDPITANFEVGRLASIEGKNIDEWSAYGPSKSNEAYGKSADAYRGALMNDLGKILDYEKPSALDNFMEAAIPAIVLSTMTAGATGMFDAGGSLASLAGNGATAGEGLLATQAAAPVTDATMTAVGSDGLASQGLIDSGVSSFGASADAAANSLAANSAIDPTVASVMAGTGKSAADAARLVAIAQSSTSGGADAVRATLTSMGVPAGVIDTLVKLAPAVAGAAIASAGGGGAKQAGTTTATETRAPWAPVQPYLTDIASKAQENYNTSSQMSPEMQKILSQAQGITSGQMNDPRMAGLRDQAADVFMGRSNAFSPVGQVTAQQVDPYGFKSQNAPAINVQNAFGSMGGTNPTQAYQSLLSGNVTNPYLQNIAQDNYTMANRNLLENVMPNIGSGATAAGQYGGSRQGIAQGLAMSRMNQDVTAANNNMFGNAYQQAQGNMLSAAGQLGGFGMSAETNNASNMLNNNQFNASLSSGISQNNANRTLSADSTNAANTLAANSQKLGQMNAGVDWFNNANNMQNTAIKNSLDLGNYGNTYAMDSLKNYSGIVSPLGGLGGTGTQSTPYYNNPTNNLLGGAIAGSTIYKNIFS